MITTQINGVNLDSTVTGFMTVKVTGREPMTIERTTASSPSVDGERVTASKYPARTISINFVLQGTSDADFREKYIALTRALYIGTAQFIFSDEPNRYYIGEAEITSVSEILHGMRGEIGVYCADPFKYSTELKRLDSSSPYWNDGAWVNVPYAGTAKAFPELTVLFPSTRNASGEETNQNEYNFVGLTMGADRILQFGDPEEKDYEWLDYKTKQYINHTFGAWGIFSTHEAGIALGDGKAYATAFGTGTGWHGPAMTAVIPFVSGDEGAANFSAEFKHSMAKSKDKQLGAIRLQILGSDNAIIAECAVIKKANGGKCNIECNANGSSIGTASGIKLSKIASTLITKEGGKVSITCGEKKKEKTIAAIADTKAYKVRVIFQQNKTTEALATNAISSVKFSKNSGIYMHEIENMFQPGDKLEVNCSDAGIRKNDIDMPSLGALGNDWETFVLEPGANTIATAFSGWKEGVSPPDAPEFELAYRERFI